ncbi:MAG: ABC-type Fe3+-hydroxamate transport system, periplasmic component [halophilic archaeon J07HX64]|nr:MAG: ABC-type Fe3+-hydroxamate transport system, periplasmic component [halophilic archaeon J07HX64]
MLVALALGLAFTAGLAGGQSTGSTVASGHTCEFPLTVEDNTGQQVEIQEEPQRVVALLPSVAQQIWEMDAEEKVVGMPVREWTSYLDGSQNRTHVLEFDDSVGLSVPDSETIVDLDPDIVLAPNEVPEDSVTELRNAGLTVYYYERPSELDGLADVLDRTGRLLGECEAADEAVEEMTGTFEFVESAVADEQRPEVFYDSGFGTTVTEGSLQHELLTTAGLENIAAGFDSLQFDPEQVVAANPEWVITTEGGQLSEFSGYNGTTALQQDRIARVDPNLFNQRGPRYADVVENLAETFHAEALAAARNNDSADDGADDSTDGSADDGADDSADDSTDGSTDNGADDSTDGSADDSTDGSTDNGADDSTDGSVDDSADDSTGEDGSEGSADGDGTGLTVVAVLVALSALVAVGRRRTDR